MESSGVLVGYVGILVVLVGQNPSQIVFLADMDDLEEITHSMRCNQGSDSF